MMKKRQPLPQMLLGKPDIHMLKTETRLLFFYPIPISTQNESKTLKKLKA
jgi:hypothetical protein